MTNTQRSFNLVAVVLPFVGFLATLVLSWNHLVDATDLIAFAVMYLLAGLGVTVGFHRLLTHRSFQTHKPLQYAFAGLGSMSLQGPVIDWVADHRKHHAHADEQGDPHSPHVDFEDGWRGALRGLFHAHMGWLFRSQGRARRHKYARDLVEDRGMRKLNRHFHWLVLLGLALPFALGLALEQTLTGALSALLWGGPVRIFLQHHATWSVNSVCHIFGRRPFASRDKATNFWPMALLAMGEN